MNKAVKRILFWTPRALSILFILFLSLFALDVFGEGYAFWRTMLALLIHLFPSILLAIALVLAWRWEWVGGGLFFGFGIWYLASAWGKYPGTMYLIIPGVPMLVGVLFLSGWMFRKEIRTEK